MNKPRLGPLFDSEKGERLKDEAIERVLANAGDDWARKVCGLVPVLFHGQVVMPEEWKIACEGMGIRPGHPNAWGGVVQSLVACGAVRRTGRRAKMNVPGSHRRETPLYRVRDLRESDFDF